MQRDSVLARPRAGGEIFDVLIVGSGVRGSIAAAPTVSRLLARELDCDDSWIEAQVRGYLLKHRGLVAAAAPSAH